MKLHFIRLQGKEITADVKFRSINSLRSISRQQRKREASKPLYLDRYELAGSVHEQSAGLNKYDA